MFIIEYRKYDGETDDELIYRICKDKEQIGTWEDVATIINKLNNTDYGESTFRKKYQAFQKMFNANQAKFVNSELQLKEIQEQKRSLERMKIQFRDERNAWQKQNFIDARTEQKLDLLEEKLSNQGRINFETHKILNVNSDNDMLVMLTDLHIGQTFNSIWGVYNTSVAKDRLNQLLCKVISIQKLHNSENCYVSVQGDLISGNIRKTIQVTNRENVIEQIKIATELISSFCYELTKVFKNVYMTNVCGNHSRIDKKEDAIHDERLDDVITWAIEISLNHIENFRVLHRNLDSGIADIIIRGKYYVAVHGDNDTFSKSGVSNLCMYLGYIPYAILYGHLHTCALDEANGVKMIRGGSLAGSGCDYTVEKRLSGKPSQMVLVCNKDGILCQYPIELK